jgi:hypothetical protein
LCCSLDVAGITVCCERRWRFAGQRGVLLLVLGFVSIEAPSAMECQ